MEGESWIGHSWSFGKGSEFLMIVVMAYKTGLGNK
jgi:hypothetical protein